VRAFKVFETDKGKIKFLFHGWNKSRLVPFNKWIAAKEKMVRDGSGKTFYLSGFHFFRTYGEAETWREKLTRTDRVTLPVIVKGIRSKEHSPHPVFLAEELLVESGR